MKSHLTSNWCDTTHGLKSAKVATINFHFLTWYQFLFCISCFLATSKNSAQERQFIDPVTIAEKMKWFEEAKLGIFIHTGIYAVNGIDESWSFYNKKISHTDYMKQLNGFTMSKFDPDFWADLIKESGARYAVITTKHHDGVALYDTKMNALSVVKASPAKRDIIQPFFEALRKRGIKCGAYFSLIDWSNDDYPGFLKDSSRYKIANDYDRWQRFRGFFQSQINEINTQFKPDLWWFDGDWEHSAEEWESAKIRQMLLSTNPKTILNSLLQGYGDYGTPEQNFPISRPAFTWWELCMTMNNNWGFQPKDTQWKTPFEIITVFVDVISKGGNLLLDIGPKADGTIPNESIKILKEIGKWNKKHSEAIFETKAGVSPGHFYGPSTLSKDAKNLYLFVPAKTAGQLLLKGLVTPIESIEVLGSTTPISYKIVGKVPHSRVPGLVFIDLPIGLTDAYMTVLKIKLKEPIQLYTGQGGL